MNIQQFPLELGAMLGNTLPLALTSMLLWGYIPLMAIAIVSLIKEKNERVKDTMKMMGMKEGLYW